MRNEVSVVVNAQGKIVDGDKGWVEPTSGSKSSKEEFLVVADESVVASCQKFVATFEERVKAESISVHDHPFWTYPHPYR